MGTGSNGTILGSFKSVKDEWVGGGWTVEPRFCVDGTAYARTDTTSLFRKDPGTNEWISLAYVGADKNVDPAELVGSHQCYAYSALYSDPNFVWMIADGYLWFSSNKGARWKKVNEFPFHAGLDPNDPANGNNAGRLLDLGQERLVGTPLMVDPANGRHCKIAAGKGGFWEATANLDGTFTVNQIAGVIPTPFGRKQLVAADPTSAVVGSGINARTQRWYVWSESTGANDSSPVPHPKGQLQVSTTGAVSNSWSVDATCPAPHSATLEVNRLNGHVWLGGGRIVADDGRWINEDSGPFYRFIPGTGWHSPTTVFAKHIAFHPTDPNLLFAVASGGEGFTSADAGSTWGSGRNKVRLAADAPWLDWTNEDYMSSGMLSADPISGKVWLGYGLGPAEGQNCFASDGSAIQWKTIAQGIDQLIGQMVKIIDKPGHKRDGVRLYTMQDRVGCAKRRHDVSKPLRRHFPNNKVAVRQGGSVDYLDSDPEKLVLCAYDQQIPDNRTHNGQPDRVYVGYSDSCGDDGSWVEVSGKPQRLHNDYGGGNIVYTGENKFFYLSTNDTPPQYSHDKGATWHWSKLGDMEPGDTTTNGWNRAYMLKFQRIIKDPFNAGHIYIFNAGDDINGAAPGSVQKGAWWRSTDHGITFTRLGDIVGALSQYFWNCQGKPNPRQAGHFIHVGGNDQGGCRLTTDYTATWKDIVGVHQAETFCFGPKWAASETYERIYFWGRLAPGQTYQALYTIKNLNPATGAGEIIELERNIDDRAGSTAGMDADWGWPGRIAMCFAGEGAFVRDYFFTNKLVSAA